MSLFVEQSVKNKEYKIILNLMTSSIVHYLCKKRFFILPFWRWYSKIFFDNNSFCYFLSMALNMRAQEVGKDSKSFHFDKTREREKERDFK